MTDLPASAETAEAAPARAEPFGQAFAGVAVLLAAIALAEPLLFGVGYYQTLTLHPFWVAVLLAACQHGLAVGLATVALATVLLGVPDRPVGVDATLHFAQSLVLPVQWLAVSLILGLYRQRQITAAEALWQRNVQLSQMNATLAREIDRMDAQLITVERAAAARMPPVPPAPVVEVAAAAPPEDAGVHSLLADLAAASTAELPAALARAAAALMEAPVVMVLKLPGEDPLVIGPPLPWAMDAEAGRRLLDRCAGVWQAGVIAPGDLGLEGAGVAVVRAQTQGAAHDLNFALAAFCEADEAATLAPRVDVLAGMARIWVDRFGHDLAAADAPDAAGSAGDA